MAIIVNGILEIKNVSCLLEKKNILKSKTLSKAKQNGTNKDTNGHTLTSFPPMDSNIFSSWTRSCWMLFIKMQGLQKENERWVWAPFPCYLCSELFRL